jgi:hypothetical protein
VQKPDRKIPPLETEVSTPLASNNNFDILSAVSKFLNVGEQTDTWKWFRFTPSYFQNVTGGALDVDIKDEGRYLWASLIQHHAMKYREVEA